MFIAVHPYNYYGKIYENKILVYDTDDLTVEYIDSAEIRRLGIEVFGLSRIVSLGTVYIPYNNLMTYYRNAMRTDKKFITFISNGAIEIHFQELTIFLSYASNFIINDFMIPGIHFSYASLLYAIKVCDRYVLRLSFREIRGNMDYYFSVAVNVDGSVDAYWLADMSICSNKALATKIDLLSEA